MKSPNTTGKGEIDDNELHHAMYGIRTLLFIETEPQSNKYHQIILTPEEYKKVNLSYGKKTGNLVREGVDEISLNLSEETYELPDLPEIYD